MSNANTIETEKLGISPTPACNKRHTVDNNRLHFDRNMKKLVMISASILQLAAPAVASAQSSETRPIGVLLAAGDITGCDKDEMLRAKATAEILRREIIQLRKGNIPVKVAILGDLAYEEGTPEQFACFEKAWGTMLKSELANPDADILPVPGNHEYKSEAAKAYFQNLKSNTWASQNLHGYFRTKFPENVQGTWAVFGLNSEIEGDNATTQDEWLSTSLAKTSEACILAFWHKPVFSSGQHGHEGGKGDAPAKQKEMAAPESLLAEHRASIILNGHDHNYEELAPHDQEGKPAAEGLRTFIVGTGGRKLRKLEGKRWPAISAVFDDEHYGVLRLDLYPGRYEWKFLSGETSPYAGEANCNPRKAE